MRANVSHRDIEENSALHFAADKGDNVIAQSLLIKGHAAASLNLLAAEVPTCVCQAGIQGTIGGNAFRKSCPQPPTSDLAITQNPTCKVETYVGGLVCCRDNHLLLDEDQDQPWPNDFLEYQMKFRFYFEEAVMAKT